MVDTSIVHPLAQPYGWLGFKSIGFLLSCEIDYIKYIAPHTIGGDDFTLVIECRSYEDLYPDYDDVFSTFFNGALFRGKPQIKAESNLRLIGNAISLFGDIGNKKDASERDEEHEMGRLFYHLYYNVVNQQSN